MFDALITKELIVTHLALGARMKQCTQYIYSLLCHEVLNNVCSNSLSALTNPQHCSNVLNDGPYFCSENNWNTQTNFIGTGQLLG